MKNPVDSSYGLDPASGAEICVTEKYKDWYRDPWSWPELNWVIGRPAEFPFGDLVTRSGSDFVLKEQTRFEPILIPKSALGVRPAVTMSLDAKILYHAAGARVLKKIHQGLPDWVYGWRYREGSQPLGVADNSAEWKDYSSFYAAKSDNHAHALQTDITSFFGSIEVERMASIIYDVAGKTAPCDILCNVIRQHDGLQTRSGLPQRSWTSAFLAHLYVRAIDDSLDERVRRGSVAAATRWMDDIHVIGKEDSLYRLFVELQDRFREIGLEANSSKSKLKPIADMHQEFRLEILDRFSIPKRTSLVGMGSGGMIRVDSGEEDLTGLLALESALIENIDASQSNVIKKLLRELRDRQIFGRYDDWLSVAHRQPHLADALGRYFRDAIEGDDAGSAIRRDTYIEWFMSFVQSDWASLSWVSSQYALAISSKYASVERVKSLLRDWLASSNDLQQVSLAGQRLAVIDPSCARDLVRRRVDAEARPLFQRSLALIALSASDDKSTVRKIIGSDSRNVVTAKFLEATRYSQVTVASDFDSAK